jgi:hypothetical protein
MRAAAFPALRVALVALEGCVAIRLGGGPGEPSAEPPPTRERRVEAALAGLGHSVGPDGDLRLLHASTTREGQTATIEYEFGGGNASRVLVDIPGFFTFRMWCRDGKGVLQSQDRTYAGRSAPDCSEADTQRARRVGRREPRREALPGPGLLGLAGALAVGAALATPRL